MKIFKMWTFKWWEVGLVKLCLASLGVILGLYFFDYLIGLLWLWWIIFILTAIYFIIKMLTEK